MTYGNTRCLCFGLALLLGSTIWSSPSAFAAAENLSSDASSKTSPNGSTPPVGSVAPPPKGAATAPAKPPEKVAPTPVAAISQDPRPTLDAGTFINTMRAAWTYKRIAEAGGWPSLPAGTVLKNGDKGPLVATLRQRLALEGDLPDNSTTSTGFDAELASAVKRFQARHGLPESGAVRARTLEALNVPALTRHRQLTASAQRLAGSTFAFGDRYVVVNIPSAAVEAVERGQVARRFVAIAGKVDRPSPTVETRVTAVNINPTWTVPVSLIKKDIIPHVRKDPAYLEKMKIRILDAKGQEVDPKTLDWSTEKAVNYTLRQDPGAINSLGQIRIDMPNKHAVYMHDTPKKQLFAQDARFHSSGCVRVADVTDFAEWLLRGTGGQAGAWTRDGINTAIAGSTRQDIRLDKPVPVAWVYLTGYATADGAVHFRDDVYGLDTPKSSPLPDPQVVDVPATASIKPKPLVDGARVTTR
ncbi:L,D-transpeptidase family protein [Microvirga mediterraneensis]|uniref:L,D-transpeptidase family protein n=1 Tax=Microvirga mediterraneensis TaxID=2754695 RepID=A0A838BLD7_9HYPH|nr:L,D-transpeptidase family protein [Microvirga mediterraneensis]MBA1156484.1 L,D-transpeptidase family protein [Microvirga mediterraneensis]